MPKQAKTTARKVNQPISKRSKSIRTKPKFYLPKTKALKRQPRVLQTIRTHTQVKDLNNPYKVLLNPLTSDKIMQKMENGNILAFLVNSRSNKIQIRDAFKALYNTGVRSVNTLIRPDGKKKAYIRLAGESEALKIASKIGII